MGMLFSLLLIAAAVGVGVMIWRANQQSSGAGKSPSGPAKAISSEPVIENVRPGGLFSIRSFGEDMEDLDVSVLNRHLYKEGRYEWIELEGETAKGNIWVTVEIDDEKEISVTLRKTELDEIGVSKADLKRMDDDEAGSFQYNGVEYRYDESDEAVFYRNSDLNDAESFYYWEFKPKGGGVFITVERWEDGSYQCHFSQPVRDRQITVYSVSGDGK